MKKIQVLVVDDKKENRDAASEYFKTREDANVDFAETYEQAIKMLNEKVYYYCLFDLELPRKEGDEPEKLGFDLAEEADNLMTPWAIITAGMGHGCSKEEQKCALVTFFLDVGNPKEDHCLSKGKSIQMTSTRKTNPLSWKLVFEFLEEMNGSNELAETKELIGFEQVKRSLRRHNFWKRPEGF